MVQTKHQKEMVQTKHQKSKQKKIKKHGKQKDISELRSQLDALDLKIIQVTADGNCFFRSLADQLEGNEEEHRKYRTMVVDYIKKNREMFEPFIEDEVPFDEYCDTMDNDGTWAGHMELQAASLVTRSNICIHHSMSPRWYIRNFEKKAAHMIHLSYHDGEHYNSVRSKEDPCDGPARPIIIMADANLTAISHQSKSAESTNSSGRGSGDNVHPRSIKMVISGSGCEDSGKVKEVLEQVGGDVDTAIEFLIAEMDAELSLAGINGSFQGHANVDETQDKEDEVNETKQKEKSSSESCKENKKIPRNRVCPCGSKKKYKNCCGVASGKTVSKLAATEIEDPLKGKKGKKQQGKRGAVSDDVSSHASHGPLSDLGALCI